MGTNPVERTPKVAEIGAAEAGRGVGLLERLAGGELDGIYLRNAYPKASMKALTRRLESETNGFPESGFKYHVRARIFGECLDFADPALDSYFNTARSFSESLRKAFADIGDFEQRATRLLGALAGGVPVGVPNGPEGRPYSFVTIRSMSEGGWVPPHCEREQPLRESYRDLRTQITPERILSYFLVIQAPLSGGALCVSSLRWDRVNPGWLDDGRARLNAVVQRLPFVRLTPEAGDMIIADGGERLHWVEECQGRQNRWTVGGFISPARAGGGWLAWS
jgi:hypothetical protein